MFGRRLLNNKQHRVNNETKSSINNKNKFFDEEIKFNEEKEIDFPLKIENKNKNKEDNNKKESKEKEQEIFCLLVVE